MAVAQVAILVEEEEEKLFKRIFTLISSTDRLLPSLDAAAGTRAENNLKGKIAKVVKGSRMEEASRNSASKEWALSLGNSVELIADLTSPPPA
jgi:hypothetical protein